MTKVHQRLAEIPLIQQVGMVVDVVPDPYENNGATICVVRSTRDDPLAGMLSRTQIDLAQYSAGRQWQGLWEEAEIGSMRGIDPTKEPVDGKGAPGSLWSDRQKNAFSELRVAAYTLGHEGDRLVRDILGERMSILLAASVRHRPAKYIGQRFRESLETLAKMWGYA